MATGKSPVRVVLWLNIKGCLSMQFIKSHQMENTLPLFSDFPGKDIPFAHVWGVIAKCALSRIPYSKTFEGNFR